MLETGETRLKRERRQISERSDVAEYTGPQRKSMKACESDYPETGRVGEEEFNHSAVAHAELGDGSTTIAMKQTLSGDDKSWWAFAGRNKRV